ncbi:MAG: penicillin-binding transpeptidase domain-containing protein [Marmoricola sp.]
MSISVDGKEFANYPDYPASALGAITLTEAIAHSCNTAMISAGDKLSKGALAQAAASLGFGVDHDLGFPAYFGEVPKPQSQTQAAADLIGQGQISASPMAIAVVMASIIKGHTVVPQLIEDQTPVKDPSAGPTKALTESAQLSQMLRAVVTQGSGAGLRGLPGPEVIAKTGTAQYGDHAPYPTHAWMVAGQGDLAVAVFVGTGESGSQTAGPLLKRFLTTAHNQVSG